MTRRIETLAQRLLREARENPAAAAARNVTHYERLAKAARASRDFATAKDCDAAASYWRAEFALVSA